MDVAIVSRKRTSSVRRLQECFANRGFKKAVYVSAKSLMLLSKGKKTYVSDGKTDLTTFDAVVMLIGPELGTFAEPLLDELHRQKIFTNVTPGAYYLTSNELYQYSELALGGCKTTASVCASTIEGIKPHLSQLTYPVLLKSFINGKKNQAIILESQRSIISLLNSIKVPVDAIVIKEFQEKDVLECAVVGKKVFGLKRQWNGTELAAPAKARPVTLSDAEQNQALLAATTCKCSVATVKLSGGKVNRVVPTINFSLFRSNRGVEIEDEIALHYQYTLEGISIPRKKEKSILDQLKERLEGFFYGKE